MGVPDGETLTLIVISALAVLFPLGMAARAFLWPSSFDNSPGSWLLVAVGMAVGVFFVIADRLPHGIAKALYPYFTIALVLLLAFLTYGLITMPLRDRRRFRTRRGGRDGDPRSGDSGPGPEAGYRGGGDGSGDGGGDGGGSGD